MQLAVISTSPEPDDDDEPMLERTVEIPPPAPPPIALDTWEYRERGLPRRPPKPAALVTPLQVAEWLAAPGDAERAFRCWARFVEPTVEPCDATATRSVVMRMRGGESLPREEVVAALLFVIRRES